MLKYWYRFENFVHERIERLLGCGRTEATWVSHALAVWGVAMVAAIGAIFWGYSPAAYVLGTLIMGAFYVAVKEPLDKIKHLIKGSYDIPQDGRKLTSRVDRIGDALAPFFMPWTLLWFLFWLLVS